MGTTVERGVIELDAAELVNTLNVIARTYGAAGTAALRSIDKITLGQDKWGQSTKDVMLTLENGVKAMAKLTRDASGYVTATARMTDATRAQAAALREVEAAMRQAEDAAALQADQKLKGRHAMMWSGIASETNPKHAIAQAAGVGVKDLKEISREIDIGASKMKEMRTQYEGTLASGTKFTATMRRDMQGLAHVHVSTMDKMSKSTRRVMLDWTSLGRLLSVQLLHRAIASSTSALRDGFTNALKLQQKLAEISTISQDTFTSMEKWASESVRISNKYGTDLFDTVESIYQTISNQIAHGIEAARFVATATELAIATASKTEDAVNALSSVLNAYGESADKATYYSAVLFKTVELGRVRLDEMANHLGDIAIMGSQLGISFEELASAVSTLTVQGLKFNRVNTQLRGLMVKLIKPTKEMQKLYDELGVSTGTAFAKVYGLAGGLDVMNAATEGNATQIAKLQNNVRGLLATLGLMSQSGAGTFDSYLKKIMDALPSYEKAVELMLDNSGRRLMKQSERIKNMFRIDFGTEAVEKLDLLTRNFEHLDTVLKSLTYGAATTFITYMLTGLDKLAIAVKGHPIVFFGTIVASLAASTLFHFEKMQKAMLQAQEDRILAAGQMAKNESNAYSDAYKQTVSEFERTSLIVLSMLRVRIRQQYSDVETGLKTLVPTVKDAYKRISDSVSEYISKLEQAKGEQQSLLDNVNEYSKTLGRDVAKTLMNFDLEGMLPEQRVSKYLQYATELRSLLAQSVSLEDVQHYGQEIRSAIMSAASEQRQLQKDGAAATYGDLRQRFLEAAQFEQNKLSEIAKSAQDEKLKLEAELSQYRQRQTLLNSKYELMLRLSTEEAIAEARKLKSEEIESHRIAYIQRLESASRDFMAAAGGAGATGQDMADFAKYADLRRREAEQGFSLAYTDRLEIEMAKAARTLTDELGPLIERVSRVDTRFRESLEIDKQRELEQRFGGLLRGQTGIRLGELSYDQRMSALEDLAKASGYKYEMSPKQLETLGLLQSKRRELADAANRIDQQRRWMIKAAEQHPSLGPLMREHGAKELPGLAGLDMQYESVTRLLQALDSFRSLPTGPAPIPNVPSQSGGGETINVDIDVENNGKAVTANDIQAAVRDGIREGLLLARSSYA